MEEQNAFYLDEDESKHLKQIEPDVGRVITLSNTGALLSASCISSTPSLEGVETSSPTFIKALLALKSTNLIRLSTMALSLGYYSGCAILLRAAFESLAYLHLFTEDADEINLWLKLELHGSLDVKKRQEERHDQLGRAKKAFTHRAPDEKQERELIEFLWDTASRYIHSSVVTLGRDFGLDFRDFLPDKFWVALEKAAGDDWDLALSLISLKAIDGRSWSASKYAEPVAKHEVYLELLGHYDEEEAGLLAIMALFLSHRLADFVFDSFEVTNPELRSDFEAWHREVKKG